MTRHDLLILASGVLLGIVLSLLILVSAASRPAVHPGVSAPSWADAGGRRAGAPRSTVVSSLDPSPAPVASDPAGAGFYAERTPSPSARLRLGVASWHHDPEVSFFGPGLYGRRTACGLALTTRLIGVAHRTLPCGTPIQFRWRGVTVTAPVVDRGPYWPHRQWDLTGGACLALRHCFTGPIDWRYP